ncbi:MAG: hypothetical protein WC665_11610 [Sulfurimonas sp.]|jgi:hypothetical protein
MNNSILTKTTNPIFIKYIGVSGESVFNENQCLFFSDENGRVLFRTSVIIECTKEDEFMRVKTLNSVYEFKIIGEVNEPTISQESVGEKNKREWHSRYKSRYFLGMNNYAYHMGLDPETVIDLEKEVFLEEAKQLFHEGVGKTIQNMACSIISPYPYEGNYYGLKNVKIDEEDFIFIDDIDEKLKMYFMTEISLKNIPIKVIDSRDVVSAWSWFSFLELQL